MSINLIQLTQSALTADVVAQLADRLGLPAEATGKALATTAPVIVAGLMQKSATLEGARSLYAALLSPEVNSFVGDQLPELLGSTGGVSRLEVAGRRLLEHVLERRIDLLTDEVSAQTRVPAHATHALAGIVGATVLGALKRRVLEDAGGIGRLPDFLSQQLVAIAPYLNDRLLAALGLGTFGAFTGNTLAQLKAVAAHDEQAVPTSAPVSGSAAAARVPADALVRTSRPASAWFWWGLAVLSLLLGSWAILFDRGSSIERRLSDAAARAGFESAGAVSAAPDAGPAITLDAAPVVVASGADVALPATSDAAPAAQVTSQGESRLGFTVNAAGKPTVTATVATEAEKIRLLLDLTQRLGHDGYVPIITVDPSVAPAAWLDRLDALQPLMTLPGAEVTVEGTHVELGGSATNAELGWLDRLESLFGASYRIGSFDVDGAVAAATANFRGALKGLLSPQGTCVAAEIVKVLNLQVVNFASGSNEVPQTAFDDLAQSGKVLGACARNGQTARLEVAGFTDNVGGEQDNLQLSKRRAQAVRDYLVKTGAPEGTLTAQGYGDRRPIASNDTERGRFANRRIEFLMQK